MTSGLFSPAFPSAPKLRRGLAHSGMTDRERPFAKGVEHGELLRHGAGREFAAQRFFAFQHAFEIKGHDAPERNVRSNSRQRAARPCRSRMAWKRPASIA